MEDEHPLFTEYKRWALLVAWSVKSKASIWALSWHEIRNAALIALWQAAKAYRSSEKVKFTTFAYIRIKGAILDECRYRGNGLASRRHPEHSPILFGDHAEIFDDKTEPADMRRVDNTEADEVTRKLIGMLRSPRQRLVLRLYYLKNMTLREIGKKLHLTESRICQIHVEAVRELTHKLKGQAADFIKLRGRR